MSEIEGTGESVGEGMGGLEDDADVDVQPRLIRGVLLRTDSACR